MTLMGLDYVVIGLLLLSIGIVATWGKQSLTQIILGSYLLIILIFGLYRCIDSIIVWLQLSPDQIGIFSIGYASLASFLINTKIRLISFFVVCLGGQIMYGSSLGTLSNNTIFYRVRQALQLPLAVVSLRSVCMIIWSGPVFFTTGLQARSAAMFHDPRIRQIVSRLPGVITTHLLLTVIATTAFSTIVDISFRINRGHRRERDAIYVERDESVRHVVE